MMINLIIIIIDITIVIICMSVVILIAKTFCYILSFRRIHHF
jgi:hypothetical protein